MKFEVTGLISVLSKPAAARPEIEHISAEQWISKADLSFDAEMHICKRTVIFPNPNVSDILSKKHTAFFIRQCFSPPAPLNLSLKCQCKYLQTEVSIQSNISAEMFCKSHKFVKAKYRRS